MPGGGFVDDVIEEGESISTSDVVDQFCELVGFCFKQRGNLASDDHPIWEAESVDVLSHLVAPKLGHPFRRGALLRLPPPRHLLDVAAFLDRSHDLFAEPRVKKLDVVQVLRLGHVVPEVY